MSAPESVSLELLLAAARDSAAVAKLREWCDKTATAASGDQSEPMFQARMGLVDEVRALLPAASTEDPSP